MLALVCCLGSSRFVLRDLLTHRLRNLKRQTHEHLFGFRLRLGVKSRCEEHSCRYVQRWVPTLKCLESHKLDGYSTRPILVLKFNVKVGSIFQTVLYDDFRSLLKQLQRLLLICVSISFIGDDRLLVLRWYVRKLKSCELTCCTENSFFVFQLRFNFCL